MAWDVAEPALFVRALLLKNSQLQDYEEKTLSFGSLGEGARRN